MHQSVQQWWNMPEGNPWSYVPVLHTFQVGLGGLVLGGRAAPASSAALWDCLLSTPSSSSLPSFVRPSAAHRGAAGELAHHGRVQHARGRGTAIPGAQGARLAACVLVGGPVRDVQDRRFSHQPRTRSLTSHPPPLPWSPPTHYPTVLQEICETWKLRTPNEWEPIQWWSQLLSWRNQASPCCCCCWGPARPPARLQGCLAALLIRCTALYCPCTRTAGVQPDHPPVWRAAEHRPQHAPDGLPVRCLLCLLRLLWPLSLLCLLSLLCFHWLPSHRLRSFHPCAPNQTLNAALCCHCPPLPPPSAATRRGASTGWAASRGCTTSPRRACRSSTLFMASTPWRCRRRLSRYGVGAAGCCLLPACLAAPLHAACGTPACTEAKACRSWADQRRN